MGATTWNYFVPYEADAASALQRLRQQVFKEGKYGSGIPKTEDMRAMLEQMIAQGPNPDEARRRMDQALAKIEQLRHLMPPEPPKPATIEALLEQRAENGTHSILDIQRISPTPDFASVCPMPADDLRTVFGTDKPTREMVEDKLGDEPLVEHPLVAERWQGTYFVVFRDGQPNELCFVGTSGD
jgi:hypothetical protein